MAGIVVSGKTARSSGAVATNSFRASKDGDHMPGTGQRVSGSGASSDVGLYSWISANAASTYDLTVGNSELRGTLTSIPIQAGAWQRIPGATRVTNVTGDVFVWDAAET